MIDLASGTIGRTSKSTPFQIRLTGSALAAAAWLLLPLAGLAAPVFDNFDDGNDSANPTWTRVDPISEYPPFGGTMTFAHWSFPGGNTYRIQADMSPDPQLGPGRAASLLPTVYSKFYVAVDLVDWNNTLDQAVGILARIGNVGLGMTTGYAFTYQELDHQVSISKITGEAASNLAGTSTSITLDNTLDYRLVFMGSGTYFEGRIYQLPDVTTPIVVVTGTDSTYASGQTGLVVYDNTSGRTGTADATYDNYYVSDHDPQVIDDDFNDGNDNSPVPAWVHYDPAGGVGGPTASWSFPGGNTYRIVAPSQAPIGCAAGQARAGSVRNELRADFTDFYCSVDLIDWDDTVRQAFGILTRLSNIGLGATDGYLFSYELGSGSLPNTTGGDTDISVISGEAPNGLPTSPSSIHLTHGRQYRMVFIGKGFDFTGKIFDTADLHNPLLVVTGSDAGASFASGKVGLVSASQGSCSVGGDCTFDNFYANSEEPRLTITPNGGNVDVSWPVLSGLWVLQSTPDITPPAVWTTITTGITHAPPINTYSVAPSGAQFYRLISP